MNKYIVMLVLVFSFATPSFAEKDSVEKEAAKLMKEMTTNIKVFDSVTKDAPESGVSTGATVVSKAKMKSQTTRGTSSVIVKSSSPFVLAANKTLSWILAHGNAGLEFTMFNQIASDVPDGFTIASSDQRGVKGRPFIKVKKDEWAVSWSPFKYKSELDFEFFGSGLGKLKVINYETPFIERYLLDTGKYSLSVGLGALYTRIDGAVSMGGFKFPTKGSGYSPMFKVTGKIQIDKLLSVGADYRKMNVTTSTAIPGVPKLVSEKYGMWSVCIMSKFGK